MNRNARLMRVLPVVLAIVAACTRGPGAAAPAAPDPAQALPRRLVLALDGIDYRDMVAARDKGLFRDFRAPSRLISTFPAISDIAWHEIFGMQPTAGYQRIYYSNAYQHMVGGTLDAITPIEYERRMDLAFGTRFHHLSAYLASNRTARNEIDRTTRDFFTFAGRKTVYVYNVGPDALQHTSGDLDAYLLHLDASLRALLEEYRARTGHDLEIAILSDHGHNKTPRARFLPINKTLREHGYHVGDQVRTSTDVAFSVDGVTTAFGIFAHPDSVPSIARLLAQMEGVELVSSRIADSAFLVQRGSLQARIDWRSSQNGDRYRYLPSSGDPLDYSSIIARMLADGALDADGFADAPTWVRYTATADFPAAVVRVVRGHVAVTLNPAPILVSAALTHRVGLGFASVTERFISLGGTHGSLSMPGSLGMVMTNFTDTHDDITATVRAQFDGFADLPPLRYASSGARITSRWLLARDPRGPFNGHVSAAVAPNGSQALEVWLTPEQTASTANGGVFFVQLLRQRPFSPTEDVIATSRLPMPAPGFEGGNGGGWTAAPTGSRFFVPLSQLELPHLAPDAEYVVRVSIEPRAGGDRNLVGTSFLDVATLKVRTTAAGELWPY